MNDSNKSLQEEAQASLLQAAKTFADRAAEEQTNFGIALLDSASRAFLAATGRSLGDPPPDPG